MALTCRSRIFHYNPAVTSPDASWTELPDDALLEKRICDLDLSLKSSDVEATIQELYANLQARGLKFFPSCYLADEWFVLEGGASIGIPFYLSHPRLIQLEEKMMLEAEGAAPAARIKLLRHEAGHAFFYAYGLNKNPKVRRLFGPSPEEIPETYRPKPYSKSFVRHLDNWYAQAEPDEDFAETFAVWLTPDLDWKAYYRGWPALAKLELMDQLMAKVAGSEPKKFLREQAFSVSELRLKLKTYYARKQKLYAQDYPNFYDRDLKAIFSTEPDASRKSAAVFLRKNRKLIVEKVSRWSREKKFIVNNLLKKLTERSQTLNLRVHKDDAEALADTTAFLTSMATNYLYTGKFKPKV